jgi:hypothetical protein
MAETFLIYTKPFQNLYASCCSDIIYNKLDMWHLLSNVPWSIIDEIDVTRHIFKHFDERFHCTNFVIHLRGDKGQWIGEDMYFFPALLIRKIVDRTDESSSQVPENIIQNKKKRTVLESVTSSEREKAWYYYSSDGWIQQPLCCSVTINLSPLLAIYKIHFSFIQLSDFIFIYKSSWLQIRRPGFDSRHYHRKK